MKVVVVGAGPAGIAAAVTASEMGAKVRLVDENPRAGGQIWRHGPGSSAPKAAGPWFRRLLDRPIDRDFGATVVGGQDGELLVSREQSGLERISYDKVILATGARELFLPFPGWTLPNVMGCGGAQALLKAGMPVRGRRAVVAGSGPLLLAVAASLVQKGAHVLGILEQADYGSVARFAARLYRHPSKARQALAYIWKCLPVLPRYGTWIRRANGKGALEGVVATDGRVDWEMDCEILACGFGLIPNTELAGSLGCRVEGGRIWVDACQRTSRQDIYCAGEGTGIAGEDAAILEGVIAAQSMLAGKDLDGKIRERARWEPFLRHLGTAFRLRPEVLRMAEDDTLVCRCEDIAYGALKHLPDQRTAKLYTRCGMGPCQGRVCGAAGQALFGWEPNISRWPLTPLEMDAMARF